MMTRKLSIVYDATRRCPMNCNICCMGASADKSCLENELTKAQKLNIADQVKELSENGYDVRIDVSGGEIFTNIPDHVELLSALSCAIGKEKVGVSCSGYKVDHNLAGQLGKIVHDVEMTMDVIPGREYKLRPSGYSMAAAKAVPLLKSAGCEVGIQTVVTTYNNSYAFAREVYDWVCSNGVDNWSILRFFPSGRGADYPEAFMNDDQCEKYVRMIREMDHSNLSERKPKIDFHYLMPGHEKYTEVCRCVRHSIGILPNGDVVACFWALDSKTGAIDPKFLLGNVTKNSLLEILNGERALYWSSCEHCCELGSGDISETKGEVVSDVLSA